MCHRNEGKGRGGGGGRRRGGGEGRIGGKGGGGGMGIGNSQRSQHISGVTLGNEGRVFEDE